MSFNFLMLYVANRFTPLKEGTQNLKRNSNL